MFTATQTNSCNTCILSVGLKLPILEVRYRNLSVETECEVVHRTFCVSIFFYFFSAFDALKFVHNQDNIYLIKASSEALLH